jgi:hypothetical protein
VTANEDEDEADAEQTAVGVDGPTEDEADAVTWYALSSAMVEAASRCHHDERLLIRSNGCCEFVLVHLQLGHAFRFEASSHLRRATCATTSTAVFDRFLSCLPPLRSRTASVRTLSTSFFGAARGGDA